MGPSEFLHAAAQRRAGAQPVREEEWTRKATTGRPNEQCVWRAMLPRPRSRGRAHTELVEVGLVALKVDVQDLRARAPSPSRV